MRTIFLSGLLVTLLLGTATVQAQENRYCDAHSRSHDAAAHNPEVARRAAEAEAEIDRQVQHFRRSRTSSTVYPRLIVPVVVHIIYDPANESATRLPYANVVDAINQLNEDFQKTTADTALVSAAYDTLIGDANVEFRLARIDPQGECTNGVLYWADSRTNSADDQVKLGRSWPNGKYLNVYVVERIASGAGGYAYLPGNAPSWEADNVLVLSRQFGNLPPSSGSFGAKRTLTHEVGHWLGLRHTWGPTNSPGLASNCSVDDGITDTPNCIGSGNGGCNRNLRTCNANELRPDNVENIMDYSSCSLMFTEGQVDRMRATLSSTRSNLGSNRNLNETGVADGLNLPDCAPKPELLTTTVRTCQGETVTLRTRSTNTIAQTGLVYNWVLPGTDQVYYTGSQITARYITAGQHSVRVIGVGPTGLKDSLDYPRAATVATNTPNLFNTPNVESFEQDIYTPADPRDAWVQTTPLAIENWNRTSDAAADGNSSLRIRNFRMQDGQRVAVHSAPINLANIQSPVLKFKWAHAPRSSSDNDVFRIYLTSNCGATQVQIGQINQNGLVVRLATAPVMAGSSFIPTQSQWNTHTIPITTPTMLNQVVKVVFEMQAGTSSGTKGMMTYLDSVAIEGTVGLTDSRNPHGLEAYPNPYQEDIQLSFQPQGSAQALIQIHDLQGREVFQAPVVQNGLGDKVQVRFSELGVPKLASGMYLVKLRQGDVVSTLRLMHQ